jgi:hypothetical protein
MSNSRASLLAAWEKLQTGLEAHQDELHLVATYREQLNTELAALKACQQKRADLQADSLQSTQDLKAAYARSRELAAFLRSCLLLSYGPYSDTLLAFGLKPIQRRKIARGKSTLDNEEGTPWKPAVTL